MQSMSTSQEISLTIHSNGQDINLTKPCTQLNGKGDLTVINRSLRELQEEVNSRLTVLVEEERAAKGTSNNAGPGGDGLEGKFF